MNHLLQLARRSAGDVIDYLHQAHVQTSVTRELEKVRCALQHARNTYEFLLKLEDRLVDASMEQDDPVLKGAK